MHISRQLICTGYFLNGIIFKFETKQGKGRLIKKYLKSKGSDILKKIHFIFPLTCLSILLIGCQSIETKETNHDNPQQSSNEQVEGEVMEVILSRSSLEDTIIFKDEASIKEFKDMISSSIKQDGIVNMSNPDYDIDIMFKKDKKQTYYLWVGENRQNGSLMKADDTHTIYTFDEETNKKISKLLQRKH